MNKTLQKKIGEWLMNDDTGLSSKCIAGILLGADPTAVVRTPHPLDPSDFGRCLRLVRFLGLTAKDLDVMTGVSDEWKAVVDNWNRWAELYDEASKRTDGSAESLYSEMRAAGL